MATIRIDRIVEKDGELKLTGLPFRKGELVHVVLSSGHGPADRAASFTAKELLHSGLIGIWKDRTDIGDSSAFARRLRDKAQHRWQ